MKMSACEPLPGDEEEDAEEAEPENKLTLDNLAQGSDYSRPFWTSFTTWILL